MAGSCACKSDGQWGCSKVDRLDERRVDRWDTSGNVWATRWVEKRAAWRVVSRADLSVVSRVVE